MGTRWARRGRRTRLAGLVLGVGGLLALAEGGSPGRLVLPSVPRVDLSASPAVEVIDVRAGNVVVVRMAGENRELRLIGTYVPHAGSAEDSARPFLQRMLEGESVHVRYDPDCPLRDRDGRCWAYVYRAPDGLFVNLELVRQGYARVAAPGLGRFEQRELLGAYERLARRNHKGVWGESAQPAVAAEEPVASQPSETVAEPENASEEDVIVYVTRTGTKYHRAGCSYLSADATPITLTEAKAKGLAPCSRCKPPE